MIRVTVEYANASHTASVERENFLVGSSVDSAEAVHAWLMKLAEESIDALLVSLTSKERTNG